MHPINIRNTNKSRSQWKKSNDKISIDKENWRRFLHIEHIANKEKKNEKITILCHWVRFINVKLAVVTKNIDGLSSLINSMCVLIRHQFLWIFRFLSLFFPDHSLCERAHWWPQTCDIILSIFMSNQFESLMVFICPACIFLMCLKKVACSCQKVFCLLKRIWFNRIESRTV